MSLSRSTCIYCDAKGCRRVYENIGSGHAVRSEAKLAGWLVGLPGGRDLCPDHVREAKKR